MRLIIKVSVLNKAEQTLSFQTRLSRYESACTSVRTDMTALSSPGSLKTEEHLLLHYRLFCYPAWCFFFLLKASASWLNGNGKEFDSSDWSEKALTPSKKRKRKREGAERAIYLVCVFLRKVSIHFEDRLPLKAKKTLETNTQVVIYNRYQADWENIKRFLPGFVCVCSREEAGVCSGLSSCVWLWRDIYIPWHIKGLTLTLYLPCQEWGSQPIKTFLCQYCSEKSIFFINLK